MILCCTIGCYLPSAFQPFDPVRGDPVPGNVVPFAQPPATGGLPFVALDPGVNSMRGPKPPEVPPWQPPVALRDWKYIVLHHTASESGSVDSIDRAHRQRKDADGNPWRGIGYHFVIGNGNGMADGEIQPTFRWLQQIEGAHAGDLEYNSYGIGICLVGNFEEHSPTAAQIAAARRLVGELKAAFHVDNSAVLCHHDVKATDCPGRYFPFDEIVN